MLSARLARGFTLVEAMVALGLMLAGIAGSCLLLLRSIQHERESATRRTAIRLAGNLAEELRALRTPDGGLLAPDAPAIAAWRGGAIAALPEGARVRVESAGTAYRIAIDWPASGWGMQQLAFAVTP